MNKIGIFLAKGFEEIEALTVVDICRRAGITVNMVSVGDLVVEGSHGIQVTADALLQEVDFEEFDMLVLPGGMPGTRNLEACDVLMEQVDAFYERGKYVAAICAAPSVLGHRGILKGREACCYPGFEEELTGAKVVYDPVAVSDHVITSRGMGCAIDFALVITEVFCGTDMSEQLAKAVIYK